MDFNCAEEARGGLLRTGSKRCFRIAAMVFAIAAFGAEVHAETVISHWTVPEIAIEEADRPDQPNVFDTIALPIRARPTSARWTKIMKASLDQPALVRRIADAKELPPEEQAAFVQLMVSHALRNRPTSTDCSDDGYWAAASETLVHGAGDCIDIAVAKMEALRLLGIPKSDLYLTTGYVGKGTASDKGRESAALLVRIGEKFWLLPERSERIIEAGGAMGASSKFAPMITYGVGITWIHGRLVKTAMLDN